jgi:hypothetical protein
MLRNIELVIAEATMGYALISIAYLNDMGRGPQLTMKVYNPREATAAGVKKIWDSMQEGRLVINRSKVHAIEIALPSRYVKPDSLSADPHKAKLVDWSQHAKGGLDAILANGQHRHLAVSQHLCGQNLATLAQIQQKYEVACQAGDKGKKAREKAEKLMMEMRRVIDEQSQWLAVFYDTGETLFIFVSLKSETEACICSIDIINASPLHKQIEAHIGNNLRMFSIPDSPDDIMRMTLQTLSTEREEQYEAVLHNVLDLIISASNKKVIAVLENHGFVKALAHLFRFPYIFANKFVSTTTMHSWGSVTREVCSDIILNSQVNSFIQLVQFWTQQLQGSYLDLKFLCSDVEVPDCKAQEAESDAGGIGWKDICEGVGKNINSEASALSDIVLQLTSHCNSEVYHNVLDDSFFIIIEHAYIKCLQEFNRNWATNEKLNKEAHGVYMEAWGIYSTHLHQQIVEWTSIRLSQLRDEDIRDIQHVPESVIIGIPNKLMWIMTGLFRNSCDRLPLWTPSPLLCPTWVKDLDNMLQVYEDWMAYVSVHYIYSLATITLCDQNEGPGSLFCDQNEGPGSLFCDQNDGPGPLFCDQNDGPGPLFCDQNDGPGPLFCVQN